MDEEEVVQRFIADMAEYRAEIEDGVRNARDFADANLEAAAATDELHGATQDLTDADYELGAATEDAKLALHGVRDSAVEAGSALGHVRDAALEAAASVKELGKSADDTSAKLDLMGLSGLSTFSSLAPMVGMIGGLVIAAAAVAPAALAMGAGFAGFGALAIPAIHGVMAGLTQISADQQAVQNAVTGKAQQTALAKLAHDWAGMSPPIRETVKDIQAFQHQFTQLAQSSGVTSQVFTDIDKILGIARQLMPTVAELATVAGPAISGMLDSISKGINSTGFIRFMATLISLVMPATAAIGHLAGAIFGVLGHAVVSLGPMSVPFINFLTDLIKALNGPVVAALHVVISLFLGLATAIEPLLPGLSKFATLLINDIGSSFTSIMPTIQTIIGLLGGAFLRILGDLQPIIANMLTPNSPFISALQMIPSILRVILPVITGLFGVLKDPTIARIAVDVLSAVVAFKAFTAVLGLVRTAFGLLTAIMEINPFVLILTGIALLVVAFIYLWDHFAGFRDFWIATWHIIQAAAKFAWAVIVADIRLQVATIEAVLRWFSTLPGLFHNWFFDVYHAIVNAWQATDSFVKSIPHRIVAALGNLGGLLISAGHAVISGLISGIEGAVPGLHSVLSWVGSLIPSWKGPLVADLQLLVPHGKAIMQGLMDGIASRQGDLHALLGGLTGGIPGAVAGAGLGGTAPSVHVTVPLTIGAGAQAYSSPAFLQYLNQAVQEATLRYSLVNPSNGLTLQGKLT
jgi:phage-related protein